MPVSSPFFTPSVAVGAAHFNATHTFEPQSEPVMQGCPLGQGRHSPPPQSSPVSPAFTALSSQWGGTQSNPEHISPGQTMTSGLIHSMHSPEKHTPELCGHGMVSGIGSLRGPLSSQWSYVHGFTSISLSLKSTCSTT
jgi:hypothetical protein